LKLCREEEKKESKRWTISIRTGREDTEIEGVNRQKRD